MLREQVLDLHQLLPQLGIPHTLIVVDFSSTDLLWHEALLCTRDLFGVCLLCHFYIEGLYRVQPPSLLRVQDKRWWLTLRLRLDVPFSLIYHPGNCFLRFLHYVKPLLSIWVFGPWANFLGHFSGF